MAEYFNQIVMSEWIQLGMLSVTEAWTLLLLSWQGEDGKGGTGGEAWHQGAWQVWHRVDLCCSRTYVTPLAALPLANTERLLLLIDPF